MKVDKSIIAGFFCAALTFISFLLEFLQSTFGLPYLFLSLKIIVFAAACLTFPLFGEKSDYKRSLMKEIYNGKTFVGNILCACLLGIAFYFFAAFCYGGAISLYEGFSGRVTIFTSSVKPSAGEILAGISLKGCLLPFVTVAFYYGALCDRFSDKKFGALTLALYATFCEFSVETAIIALLLNLLVSSCTKKCGYKTIIPIIITLIYSLLNVIFPLVAALPFSYRLVTSPETAKYYGFVSVGIGLIFLAAVVLIYSLLKKEDNEGKPLLTITPDDRFAFFGTAAMYVVLTIVGCFI